MITSTWKYEVKRKLTTSTGEPIQTAKNPAPRPASTWVKTVSVNPGIFKIVCSGRKKNLE